MNKISGACETIKKKKNYDNQIIGISEEGEGKRVQC